MALKLYQVKYVMNRDAVLYYSYNLGTIVRRLSALSLIMIAILLLTDTIVFAKSITGKCIGVSDGDTIKVLYGKVPINVRLEGIDCPELHQDFGKRAKQFTSSLVFGKIVSVNVVKIDQYGRRVARVLVGGRDVSLELVKAGLAWHYKHYLSDFLLAKAEERARAQKIGLWSMSNPIPPWEYRHRRKH